MILDLRKYGYNGDISTISITPSCGGATKQKTDSFSNEIYIAIYASNSIIVIECSSKGMTNKQINTLFRHIDLACTYPEHELLERFPEEFV